jgi:hypothetical protein
MPRFDVDIHDQARDDFATRVADMPHDRALALAAQIYEEWGHDDSLLWWRANTVHGDMNAALDNNPNACGMCGGCGCASCKMTGRAALDDELQGRR